MDFEELLFDSFEEVLLDETTVQPNNTTVDYYADDDSYDILSLSSATSSHLSSVNLMEHFDIETAFERFDIEDNDVDESNPHDRIVRLILSFLDLL